MAAPFQTVKSIVGRRLGLGKYGNLVASESGSPIELTPKCAGARITIGAENTNVRAITIQLIDANGDDVAVGEIVKVYVFADATRIALAGTGGSTGIAIGTDGTILRTITAKKQFEIISEADGDIDLTWTDTATESVVLGVLLPNGVWAMSEAFANAP